MDERTTGVVLRTYSLTETSLIVHWITRDFGRIATVARGALRPKSAFRGKLDLFHRCELLFTPSRRSELHTLKEVELLETNPAIRRDFECLQKAVYAAALVEQTTETDAPVPELYALLNSFLETLAHDTSVIPVMAFELKALSLLGLGADLENARMSPGTKKLARFLEERAWADLKLLRATRLQLREISVFLKSFLGYHLEKVPRGRDKIILLADDESGNRPRAGLERGGSSGEL